MCEHQKQEVCGEQVCGVCFGEQLTQGRVESHRETTRSVEFVKHVKGGGSTVEMAARLAHLMRTNVKAYSVEERERLWRKVGHRVAELDERGAEAVFKGM